MTIISQIARRNVTFEIKLESHTRLLVNFDNGKLTKIRSVGEGLLRSDQRTSMMMKLTVANTPKRQLFVGYQNSHNNFQHVRTDRYLKERKKKLKQIVNFRIFPSLGVPGN